MNIIFIITGLRIGGAERIVVDMAEGLSNRGHNVSIISLINDIQLRPKNSKISVISFNFQYNPFIFIYNIIRLFVYLKNQKANIIHSHMYHSNIIVSLIRFALPNVRFIFTSHSSNEGGKFKMFLYRIFFQKNGMLTTVSIDAANEIKKLTGITNIPIIKNGVNVEKFRYNNDKRLELRNKFSINENKIVIMGVGRLVKAKGFNNLIDAFRKLYFEFPNILLIIVGGGAEKNNLLNQIRQYNLSDQIKLIGSSNDVHHLMSTCDIFVLSSIWEGFSLVVAEAMSCQRVVVATDCGAVSDMLYESRFLVKANDIEDLFEKLKLAILLSVQESKIIGIQSRKKIQENFSIEIMIDKWISYYMS